jgi:hypothetical protein
MVVTHHHTHVVGVNDICPHEMYFNMNNNRVGNLRTLNFSPLQGFDNQINTLHVCLLEASFPTKMLLSTTTTNATNILKEDGS